MSTSFENFKNMSTCSFPPENDSNAAQAMFLHSAKSVFLDPQNNVISFGMRGIKKWTEIFTFYIEVAVRALLKLEPLTLILKP